MAYSIKNFINTENSKITDKESCFKISERTFRELCACGTNIKRQVICNLSDSAIFIRDDIIQWTVGETKPTSGSNIIREFLDKTIHSSKNNGYNEKRIEGISECSGTGIITTKFIPDYFTFLDISNWNKVRVSKDAFVACSNTIKIYNDNANGSNNNGYYLLEGSKGIVCLRTKFNSSELIKIELNCDTVKCNKDVLNDRNLVVLYSDTIEKCVGSFGDGSSDVYKGSGILIMYPC